jgi:hypothetical protein
VVVVVPKILFHKSMKASKIHVVADALSRLLDITKPISVPNQTTDVSLFYIELEWLNDVKF